MTVLRAAVVGAGPAGFYTTEQLLAAGFEVDLLDALPTPFGLVRAGVAPDHPKIKSVTRAYDRTAERPGFRFVGDVEVGRDVAVDDLLARYHAVVYAVGTARDVRLGIPGEDRHGSYAATQFVGWYNGHPAHAGRQFDLSAERAVVIGNGNVAMDVARMLLLDRAELAATDTADHAIEALAAANVREVVLVGRRGPAQAAFTTPELRELGELADVDVVVDPAELELDAHTREALGDEPDAVVARNLEVLRDYAARPAAGRTRRVVLRFLRSPVEIMGSGDGRVEGLRVVRNRIEPGSDGALRAVATGEQEVIGCGLVLRSIGYRGEALPGVPFDPARAVIRNAAGRVLDDDGNHLAGQYAVGWIKRGPSGVIGTNKKDATETVAAILQDAERGALNDPAHADAASTLAFLRERVPGLVTWGGWTAIDEHERRSGEPQGRPRVKVVRLPELRSIATLGASTSA